MEEAGLMLHVATHWHMHFLFNVISTLEMRCDRSMLTKVESQNGGNLAGNISDVAQDGHMQNAADGVAACSDLMTLLLQAVRSTAAEQVHRAVQSGSGSIWAAHRKQRPGWLKSDQQRSQCSRAQAHLPRSR